MRGGAPSARRRLIRGALALVLLAWAAPAPLRAQTPPAQAEAVAADAISRLRSPFCPGLMLEICPSTQAAYLRDSIRARAAAGEPADQIIERELAHHGQEWRAVPKKQGFGLFAWFATPVILLGGALIAVRGARRLRGAAAEPPPQTISPEERARLDAELAEWDEAEAMA